MNKTANKNKLFHFSNKNSVNFSPSNPENSFKRYLKRFFKKKLNWAILTLFILFILFVYITSLSYKYSSSQPVKNNELFLDLPNYSLNLIFKKFNLDDPIYRIIKNNNEINPNIIISESFVSDKVNLTYRPYLLLKTIYNENYVLLFGTTSLGISRFSNFINSMSKTILIILGIILIQLIIGVILGTYFAFYSKYAPIKISYFLFNTISLVPFIVLSIIIFKFLGYSDSKYVLVTSLLGFINFFYNAYNETNIIKNKEYINAYKSIGLGNQRIIWKIIIPSIFFSILSTIGENISLNLLILSSLAFFNIPNIETSLNIGNVFRQIIVDKNNVEYIIFVIFNISFFVFITKLLSLKIHLAYNVKGSK